jgi:hypothetical protein
MKELDPHRTMDQNQGDNAHQRWSIGAKTKTVCEGLDHGRDMERNRRKITKQKINNANETKPTLLAEYSEINKRVKKYARRDTRNTIQ